MTPFTADQIRGNWATLLLPIQADDAIDFGLLGEEIEHFIAARMNGIYSNGTAGEFHTQTEAEFDRVNALLAAKCERAAMPFQIGASHTSAQIARERVRRAKTLRPVAFQVTLPDWFPPALPEVIAFLETMAAEAAPIPLIVYNPPHAKRRLTPEEWASVADAVPGVIGMKVAGGDDAWYAAMAPLLARLSVFIPGHTLPEGLARGARGAYSNVACLSPAGARRWYDLCLTDLPAARALGERISAFWLGNISPLIRRDGLSPMAADKTAAVAGGWLPELTTRVRWPYRSVAADTAVRIGIIARAELPELF
ncbi:dihydrodipicolinate synthase family protein [Horticoccus sp. 23ND18S-11]|uniref:dihydrodipicolinate synthase family protein n=1 Tax=Horticoccus sp. 23ND18S-11 TaxID=3391832 RepID=UPI0039C8FF4B